MLSLNRTTESLIHPNNMVLDMLGVENRRGGILTLRNRVDLELS